MGYTPICIYIYIYIYGIIIHEYPLYYIWDDIDYMGFVWIINHLLRLNSWYLAIQSPHLETARDVIRRIPLHAILAFFGFVSNGQAIGPKNAPMGRLRPGAGIEGEQAGRAKAEDRNLARRSRSMFDAFRIRHASGLHGSSWFIISYITLYIYNIYSTLYIYIYCTFIISGYRYNIYSMYMFSLFFQSGWLQYTC